MIAYCSKLLTEKETALFKLFLAIQLNQDIGKIYCFDCIKTTLNHVGLSNISLELNIQNTKWLKVKSKKKHVLIDQFFLSWQSILQRLLKLNIIDDTRKN